MKLKLLFPAYPALDDRVEYTVQLNRMAFKVGNGGSDAKVGHKGLQAYSKAGGRGVSVLCHRPRSMRQIDHRLPIAQSRDLGHQSVHVSVFRVRSGNVSGLVSSRWWKTWVLRQKGEETDKLGAETAVHIRHPGRIQISRLMVGIQVLLAKEKCGFS